jgi:hypothetical protein
VKQERVCTTVCSPEEVLCLKGCRTCRPGIPLTGKWFTMYRTFGLSHDSIGSADCAQVIGFIVTNGIKPVTRYYQPFPIAVPRSHYADV